MLGKLKHLQEENTQQRNLEEIQNAKPENIAKSLLFAIADKIIQDEHDRIENRSTKIKVNCFILQSFALEPEEASAEAILSKKRELMSKVNDISQLNSPLIVQYLGVSVTKKNKSSQEVNKPATQIEKEKAKNVQENEKEEVKRQEQKKLKQKSEDSQTVISLLAEQNLSPVDQDKWREQPKTKEDVSNRIVFCRQVIQAIAFIHSRELSFFPEYAHSAIILSNKVFLKVLAHKTKSWRDTTEREVEEIKDKQSKKMKMSGLTNRPTKFIAPEFVFKKTQIKDIRMNDIWKVGIFVLSVLIGEDLSKQVLGLENVDEEKAHTYKIVSEQRQAKLKKHFKASVINQLLKTINFTPEERKPMDELLKDFKAYESELMQKFCERSIISSKKKYLQAQSQNTVKFMLQLKANEELLTQDNKKRLTDYFKSAQHRVLKNFKLLHRGSLSKFSSRCFYEAGVEKKNILVVIQEKKDKKKLICYSEQSFDQKKNNGIFGAFIKDARKLSFIYSPQENQFCKIKNAEKSIGVGYIQGPIIGDGDIVISDGGLYNTCRFPQSYEPTGKVKKLLKSQKFQLEQYDVYQLIF